MTTPSIMAYAGQSGTITTVTNNKILFDSARNLVYRISSGNSLTANGIIAFVGWQSGGVYLERTNGQLGILEIQGTGGAAALTPSGYIVTNLNQSNSVTMGVIYGPTLAVVSQFGVPGSSLSPSTMGPPNRIVCPGSICFIGYGKQEAVVTCAFVTNEVCVLTVPGCQLQNLGNLDEQVGCCGTGPVGSSSGTAWVLGHSTTTNSTPIGIYKVTWGPGGGVLSKLTTIAPTAIDATWTNFSSAHGFAWDQTDNNPIMAVNTTDAVTNKNYIVKLNGATGAIIWKVAVGNPDASGENDMGRHIIKNSTLYLCEASVLYTINTAAGTVSTSTFSSLSATGAQLSEDISNSLFIDGTWSEVSTHPTYIGTYMGTGGNHTLNQTPARIWPGGDTAWPSPPALKQPPVSPNHAWSFVLDGHTFYVLDLGAQGSFAFDTVTQQWCEFQTAGSNFNMVNGVMWGQRIVGGDIATSDLWEMDPAATKDSGGLYEISHVVTGGLSTRSRTFISCSAVRISASFGVVDDTGVTFNLRFSDDQGNTWSPFYPVTLTAGDVGSEVAWRSLGSFCAPGRIFEFSDSGGLVRIDGCDAFLDGFDNDQQSQDGGDGG